MTRASHTWPQPFTFPMADQPGQLLSEWNRGCISILKGLGYTLREKLSWRGPIIIIQHCNFEFSIWTKSWDDNYFLTGLCAGTYTIQVVDSVGCTASDTFTIVQNGLIFGCTDIQAENYDTYATIDDGSCLYCDLNVTINSIQNSYQISTDIDICFRIQVKLLPLIGMEPIFYWYLYRYWLFYRYLYQY